MFKRLVDIIFALCILCLFSPVIALISILIRLKLGPPILFRQPRPGLHGKPILLLKFRTMCGARDANNRLLSDDERLDSFGLWLRSTSLDELPELWNVLKGDMSLVGPRPLLMEYLPLYSQEQRRRHEVRPGITGWAQVNGRNNLSWEEKFKLDVWYVDHRTLWLDLKILLLTVKKVISREGINAQGQATCEKFRGSDS
ncbi:sugar transferase [Marinobacterium aestuarii]|uniref:Sugar transferase n=1 Tax=Marinobacterium aestuarii TaxID=1821621 RepID=A0A1A9EUG2_9GAMM|nr:sugar transferase [Marinobacterium aestuarii]ANG61794.1 sugar transferase [Marinobacterium aestuarii]